MTSNKKPKMSPEEMLKFRKRNEYSQKELAELIGVTWQAVRLWELGERTIPETTVRLILLFKKFPQLIQEF